MLVTSMGRTVFADDALTHHPIRIGIDGRECHVDEDDLDTAFEMVREGTGAKAKAEKDAEAFIRSRARVI